MQAFCEDDGILTPHSLARNLLASRAQGTIHDYGTAGGKPNISLVPPAVSFFAQEVFIGYPAKTMNFFRIVQIFHTTQYLNWSDLRKQMENERQKSKKSRGQWTGKAGKNLHLCSSHKVKCTKNRGLARDLLWYRVQSNSFFTFMHRRTLPTPFFKSDDAFFMLQYLIFISDSH